MNKGPKKLERTFTIFGFQKISRHPFFRNVAILTATAALGQLLAIGGTPILSRLFTPAAFGIFAAFSSIVAVISAVSSFKFDMAIPLPKEKARGARIFILSLIALGFVILVTSMGVFLTTNTDLKIRKLFFLEPFLKYLPLGILAEGLFLPVSYWAIRDRLFVPLGKAQIWRSVLSLSGQIVSGLWLGGSPASLIVGHYLGRFLGTLKISAQALSKCAPFLSRLTLKDLKADAKIYWRFPVITGPASLLNVSADSLVRLLLGIHLGTGALGIFAMGYQIIFAPCNLVANAVAKVFLADAAQYDENRTVHLRRAYRKRIRQLFLMAILPSLIVLCWGPELFATVFGEPWREAGSMAQFLIPALLAQFCVTPMINFSIVKREDLYFAWNIFNFVINIGALLLAMALSLEWRGTIALYSAAQVISDGTLFFVYDHALKTKRKNSVSSSSLRPDDSPR